MLINFGEQEDVSSSEGSFGFCPMPNQEFAFVPFLGDEAPSLFETHVKSFEVRSCWLMSIKLLLSLST